MRYLPKVPAVELASLLVAALFTCAIPALYIPTVAEWNRTVGAVFTAVFGVGIGVASLLNVTCPFWIHLHPAIVLGCIHALALVSFGSGAQLLVAGEVAAGTTLGRTVVEWISIGSHLSQVILASMVGRTLEKSPERTAPFNSNRCVPMLCGGALMVAGAISAIFVLDDKKYFNLFGIKLGGCPTYVVFGILLAFPLWHRHENPLVRGGIASCTIVLLWITPFLGLCRVAMFYPVWLPGQILVAYALGGYQGEAEREIVIKMTNTAQDEHGDSDRHSALPCEEEPLAGAAHPVSGIAAV